jgi:hypothetical protein
MDTAAALAATLSRAVQHTEASESQRNCARLFCARWRVIHECLRPAVETACLERALKPASLALSLILPDVDVCVRQREDKLTDFDSCRRRMRALEDKRDSVVADKSGSAGTARPNKAIEEVRNVMYLV